MNREYKLVRWYPSLPTEWKDNDFPIIVVERDSGFLLHPSLKGLTRDINIPLTEREVVKNSEFWEEIKPEKDYEILSYYQESNVHGKFIYYESHKNWNYIEKQNYRIHSVKRLSDNVEFSINDTAKTVTSRGHHTITGFKVRQKVIDRNKQDGSWNYNGIDRIWVEWEEDCGGNWLDKIEHYKKEPLFITDFEVISWLSNNKLESIYNEKCYFDPKFDTIQSVMRKSDNAQFKIGERVKEGIITKIIIKKDKIYLEV